MVGEDGLSILLRSQLYYGSTNKHAIFHIMDCGGVLILCICCEVACRCFGDQLEPQLFENFIDGSHWIHYGVDAEVDSIASFGK